MSRLTTNKRGFRTTALLLMGLLIVLGALAVGYGLWSKTLFINGTVNTGNVDAVFIEAFTDDDDFIDNANKDGANTGAGTPGDDDSCDDIGGVDDVGALNQFKDGSDNGRTSCDPLEPGPNPERWDKDVGRCDAKIDTEDDQILHVEVNNGYPSYWCTVWYDIENTGSIPVKIQQLQLTPNNFTNGVEVTVSLSQVACGTQIDPGDEQQGDIRIHVEQKAAQGASYSFTGSLKLVQWNEHDPSQCIKLPLSWQTCSAGEGACIEDPDVAISLSADDTIDMGDCAVSSTNCAETDQQPTSVHGASAVLPVGAASYTVAVIYEFCTWDSYNALGSNQPNDGFWDSFSISVSQDAPYWNVLTQPADPIGDIAGTIDFSVIDGGTQFNDGNLVGASCGAPVTTNLTMAGDPSKTNYLNVAVDTASLPQANHNFPSWATVNVNSVTIP